MLSFALIILLGWVFLRAGLFISSPMKIPVRADAIVILGGGWTERITYGDELYKKRYAGKILLIGFDEHVAKSGDYYSSWKTKGLLAAGVPREHIYFDVVSRNTHEEAVNTLLFMKKNGWQHVLVVTDPPHVRRATMTWSRVFSDSQLTFSCVSCSPLWWQANKWWQNERSRNFVLGEYVKLMYYTVAYWKEFPTSLLQRQEHEKLMTVNRK